MAIFVDLDDDNEPPDAAARYAAECQARAALENDGIKALNISETPSQDVDMTNLNRNSITEVFACYP